MRLNDAWKRWAGQVAAEKFPLRQYLGSSDHSVVYLTEWSGQGAAIKFVAANERTAEAQLSRWASTTKLSHAHLLRLFEAGRCELGGTRLLYVVMEYAEESLSQILPERALRPNEVRDMLPPILRVLEYLHRNGLVHAGLKPANIMAVGDQLKISSDGLRSVGERAPGDGGYDAPEIGNEPLSPASDVWSLGVTLVEVLTQRLPGPAVQMEPVVPPTLPSPYFEIARNCLRLYPQRRWKLPEISAALSGTSVKSEQEFRQHLFPKWRYAVPAVGVIAVLAVLLLGPKLFQHDAGAPPAMPAQTSPAVARSAIRQETPKAEAIPAKPAAGKGAAGNPTSVAASPAISAAPPESPSSGVPKSEEGAGAVVHQVIPNVPESARNTITGKVRVWVRVAVDASGNVTGTTFDRPGPSKYFARLAQQAAERWKFTPTPSDRQYVPREWVLRFEFGRESTQVLPTPAAGTAPKP